MDFAREILNKHKMTEITKKDVLSYQNYLYYYKDKTGKANKMETQRRKITIVKMFFLFLQKTNRILTNPAIDIELPKSETKTGRHPLKEAEMGKIFSHIDYTSLEGYRDRIIFEIFYTTGIRISELRNLRVKDINSDEKTLFIEDGKGGKDRYVPMCEALRKYLQEYLTKVRPGLLQNRQDDGYLILSTNGKKILSNQLINRKIKHYCELAGIKNWIRAYHFRVTCGSLMLKHGASERYVQEILGHSVLNTTERYLSVQMDDLKQTHNRFHPRDEELSGPMR